MAASVVVASSVHAYARMLRSGPRKLVGVPDAGLKLGGRPEAIRHSMRATVMRAWRRLWLLCSVISNWTGRPFSPRRSEPWPPLCRWSRFGRVHGPRRRPHQALPHLMGAVRSRDDEEVNRQKNVGGSARGDFLKP